VRQSLGKEDEVRRLIQVERMWVETPCIVDHMAVVTRAVRCSGLAANKNQRSLAKCLAPTTDVLRYKFWKQRVAYSTLEDNSPSGVHTVCVHFAIHNKKNYSFLKDSVVGIVTKVHDGKCGVRIPAGARDFSPPQNRPDRLWGPPSRLFKGYRGTLPGVKLLGREFEHSAPSTAEVTNESSYTYTPLICLHGVDSRNFTFITRVGHVTPKGDTRNV
jgi:hypothetical protein